MQKMVEYCTNHNFMPQSCQQDSSIQRFPSRSSFNAIGSTPVTINATPGANPHIPRTWPRVPDQVVSKTADTLITLGKGIRDGAEATDSIMPSPTFAFFTGLYVQGYNDSSIDIEPGEKIVRSLSVAGEYVITDFAATSFGTAGAAVAGTLGIESGPLDIAVTGAGYGIPAVASTFAINFLWEKFNEESLFPYMHSLFLP
jgi:hypothetical protein